MKTKVLIIILGIIVLFAAMLIGVTSGMGEIKKLVISDVDLTMIADGVYKGSYHKNRWTYDAEVTVSNHKITSIKNTNEKMKKAEKFNEKVAMEIIKKQSPKIDAVSGATISTKAFAMAVENALTTGLKKQPYLK
jgi:uncharacterized protein with FMN-binding domain